MSLKNDMKKLFEQLLGAEIAKQIDSFDNPDKYPGDFYEECEHFLAEMIGKDAAESKLQEIHNKYMEGKKSGSGADSLSKPNHSNIINNIWEEMMFSTHLNFPIQ